MTQYDTAHIDGNRSGVIRDESDPGTASRNRQSGEVYDLRGLRGGLYLDYHLDYEKGHINAHDHLAHELIFVVSGAARYTIGETVYDLQEQSLLMVGRLERHRIEITRTPYRRIFMLIDATYAQTVLKNPRLMQSFANRPERYRQQLAFDADFFSGLLATLDEIAIEQLMKKPFHNESIAALFQGLMIDLYRVSHHDQKPATLTPVQEQVLKVQQYIDLHAEENLSLEEMASRFYLNPFTLSRTFRQLTGFPLSRYVSRLRLSLARDLLSGSSLRVCDIAEKTGFGDTNTFIRQFRREEGVTPLQYRLRGAERGQDTGSAV